MARFRVTFSYINAQQLIKHGLSNMHAWIQDSNVNQSQVKYRRDGYMI